MPTGAVFYKITHLHADETGAQVEVSANVTKWVEDEDGAMQSIGSWAGRLSYAKAGFGARTFASVRAELLAEIKAKHQALSGKTLS